MSTQPVTSSTTNRIVLDYTSRDYKAIRSMLVGLAKGLMPEWTTVGETGDFGTLLLELYAYAGDVNNYYIDRIASEAFLGTAIRRQSVMYIADMLGYVPIGQRAATVPLSFTWKWNETVNPIPVYTYKVTQASINSGKVTLRLSTSGSDYRIKIVQGQTITVSGIGIDFDGVYLITTVTPDTATTNVDITYEAISAVTGTAFPSVTYKELTDNVVTLTTSSVHTFHTDDIVVVTGVGPVFNGTYTITGITPTTFSYAKTNTDIASTAVTSGSATTITDASQISTGSIVKIPAGTFITTAPDTKGNVTVFELNFDVVLDSENKKPVSDTTPNIVSVSKLASASEGVTVTPTLAGVSKGIPNAEFILANAGVIDRTVQVYTKEGGQVVQWSNIDKISLGSPTQSVFTTYVDDNNYTHVMFGDNASGRIPPTNVEIYVSYRYGVGKSANSLAVNTITSLNNDFATQSGITVTNTSSPAGGADIESTESIRYSVPRATALKQRAVSIDDYVSLALQVPGITKAIAYGANYTTVYVRVASNETSKGYSEVSVTTKAVKSLTAILAISDSLNLSTGQTVYVSGVGSGFNGSVKLTKVYYEGTTKKVLNKELTSNVAYLKVANFGDLVVGQPINVSINDPIFDGDHILTNITSVTGGYKLAFSKSHGDVTSAAVTGNTKVVKPIAGIAYETVNTDSDETAVSGGKVTCSDPDMQALINSLESYLSDKKMIGAVVYGEPVEWTNIDINISVSVLPLYNRDSVGTAVKTAVKKLISYDNVNFGKRISIGDVYRAALLVDGVDYVTINVFKPTGYGTSIVDVDTESAGTSYEYKLPRINPYVIDADDWVITKGGLANT